MSIHPNEFVRLAKSGKPPLPPHPSVDVKLSIFGGGHEQFRIDNVWRASIPLKAVQAAMGQKATVVI
jgi:hypothetical protein